MLGGRENVWLAFMKASGNIYMIINATKKLIVKDAGKTHDFDTRHSVNGKMMKTTSAEKYAIAKGVLRRRKDLTMIFIKSVQSIAGTVKSF